MLFSSLIKTYLPKKTSYICLQKMYVLVHYLHTHKKGLPSTHTHSAQNAHTSILKKTLTFTFFMHTPDQVGKSACQFWCCNRYILLTWWIKFIEKSKIILTCINKGSSFLHIIRRLENVSIFVQKYIFYRSLVLFLFRF